MWRQTHDQAQGAHMTEIVGYRGIPDVPALRISKRGIRFNQALYKGMGCPSTVDIVLDTRERRLGLRLGPRHRTRRYSMDTAIRVHSRKVGRAVAPSSRGRWLIVEREDDTWWAKAILSNEEMP